MLQNLTCKAFGGVSTNRVFVICLHFICLFSILWFIPKQILTRGGYASQLTKLYLCMLRICAVVQHQNKTAKWGMMKMPLMTADG